MPLWAGAIKLNYHLNYDPGKFGSHRHCGNGDIKYHKIKALNDFMVSSPSSYVIILPRLLQIDTVVVKT